MPILSAPSIPEIGSDAPPLAPDLPLTDAAEPATSVIQRILRVLKKYWRVFQDDRQRHRLRMALLGLTERDLKDIGITNADIDHIAAHRTIDRLRDGTMYP